ncbi:MAG: YraN family protein [Clostridiales bacterium]|nr:YraN family protein [Clostridiales bacterium]
MRYKKNVGDNGEDFAARMLEDSGYEIIERNFATKFGEIDIIAYKEGVLHFVEVKTRTGMEYGFPSDAITEEKKFRMRRAAEIYLTRRRTFWRRVSIDVYEVMANLITDCV